MIIRKSHCSVRVIVLIFGPCTSYDSFWFYSSVHLLRHQERSQAPGEVVSSYRQSSVARQGNHAVQDVVVFAVQLWNFPEEIGGVEFWPVNHHSASLGHHGTWMINTSIGPLELIFFLALAFTHLKVYNLALSLQFIFHMYHLFILHWEEKCNIYQIRKIFAHTHTVTQHLHCSVAWSCVEGCRDVRWPGRRSRWWRSVEEGKQGERTRWKRKSLQPTIPLTLACSDHTR